MSFLRQWSTSKKTFYQNTITAYDDDGDEEVDVFIGDTNEQYLRKFASVSGAGKTVGLRMRDKDGKFYIGNKEVKKENNLIVGMIFD